ncbi:MAG: amino acid permease [Candidatus Peregrinibacteria bacterium Greene1014_49]|nr:MAG: amino acid permease [Candidatus Peregrinibacteria bacterium Greene1014_49]
MSSSPSPHPKLGPAAATAICGNDILSSCLYVSGIAILFCGVFAPFVLAFIAFILFLYKLVYTEVVEALPVNGGAYNCLLNGTTKVVASVAGAMTFLSYIATAVISAKVAVEYMHTIVPSIPVIPATIALLGVFAFLVIFGIKDSSKVALGIFITHIITLFLFLALGAYATSKGVTHFTDNFHRTAELVTEKGGLFNMLYLAFAASLLGVSGFESSANFVEEQGKGVFRLTLRNMLLGVAFFNPLIALVVLQSMPYDAIVAAKDFLLADAANVIGGHSFKILVVIDAFLVLSGAVLTSYIGVSGLLNRMSSDGCIPGLFSKQNKRGAFPRIILGFFALCSSILILTKGNLLALAGVYTIAFLGVMSMFALGNIILKQSRSELKRTYSAPLSAVAIALLATSFGVIGNIRIDFNNLIFFEIYFIPTIFIIFCVIYNDRILRTLLKVTTDLPTFHGWLQRRFSDISSGRFVAFVHNVSRLAPILEYIDRNETGRKLTLVHCSGDKKGEQEIRETLPHLQKAGAFTNFEIDYLCKDMPFGPEVIDVISRELGVRKNRILIGSIHHSHAFDYADLGGVRIIF